MNMPEYYSTEVIDLRLVNLFLVWLFSLLDQDMSRNARNCKTNKFNKTVTKY